MRFFQKGSPFLAVPTGLEPLQRAWFDAVRGSCEIAELSYSRLEVSLYTWSKENSGVEFEPDCSVADAWSFVDATHRLSLLLRATGKVFPHPKGSPVDKKSPRYRLHEDFKLARKSFEVAIRGIKPSRDGVQHLDEKLEMIGTSKDVVWGSMSWTAIVEKEGEAPLKELCAIIPGFLFDGATSAVWDTHAPITEPVGNVCLHAHGQRLELTNIRKLMRPPITILESIFGPQFQGKPSTAGQSLIRLKVSRESEDPYSRRTPSVAS